MDILNKEYGGSNFRIIVSEPTTTIPKVEIKKEKEEFLSNKADKDKNNNNNKNKNNNKNNKNNNIIKSRLSRHEIYDSLFSSMNSIGEYYLMLIIASIVASIGLIKNDVAIIISSMIIAPLLVPNIALSFSICVADWELAKKSLSNLLIGIFLAFIISLLFGYMFPISLDNPQITSRLYLSFFDVAIALCAGVIGAVSTVSGVSSVAIGVMIAVALLPPLAAFGLLVGSGYMFEGIPILLLFITNIIGVNLSSSLMFYSYGISPYKWWKKENAIKSTKISILVWFLLMIIAIILIQYSISLN